MHRFSKKMSVKAGVTLVEILMMIFVSSTIVVATMALFGSASKSEKFSQSSQKKYDAAFTAVGEVGKLLSTSTTKLTLSQSGSKTALYVYNYSTNECIEFKFNNTQATLVARKAVMLDTEYYKTCSDTYLNQPSTASRLSTSELIGDIRGYFFVRSLSETTNPKRSGFVTLYAKVYDGDPTVSGSKWIPLQTTLSFRDYLVND